MNLSPFAAAMIRANGSEWTSSSGTTFKAMGPTGSSLSIPADTPISPGEVLTRSLDSAQYLVVNHDHRQTHIALAVEQITHQLTIKRIIEGTRDTFGRAHSNLATIADNIPAVLQGRFSTSVDQEPDRPVTLSRGLFLLSDSTDAQENDIVLLKSGDKFKVVEKLRALPGIVTIRIETIN